MKRIEKFEGYEIETDVRYDGTYATLLLEDGSRYRKEFSAEIYPREIYDAFISPTELSIRQQNENIRAACAFEIAMRTLIHEYNWSTDNEK